LSEIQLPSAVWQAGAAPSAYAAKPPADPATQADLRIITLNRDSGRYYNPPTFDKLVQSSRIFPD